MLNIPSMTRLFSDRYWINEVYVVHDFFANETKVSNHGCTSPKQQKGEVVPSVIGTHEGQNKLTTPFCPHTHWFQPSKCSVTNSLVPIIILGSGEMALSRQQHLHVSSYGIIKESITVAPGQLHGLLQEQGICNTKTPLDQLRCFPWNTTYF